MKDTKDLLARHVYRITPETFVLFGAYSRWQAKMLAEEYTKTEKGFRDYKERVLSLRDQE